MRLTLRTLLAYLDDRLSPVNAREIGQKISTSPFATELADRIKDVVRKRRLGVPDPQRKVIDANLIAEYLDDQLTPEVVAIIEKEVLSSDFSLAEVAASHQILGLLGETVELESRVRERLYALDPHTRANSSEPAAVTETSSDTDADAWAPLAPAQPTTQRWSPLWLVVVLLVGWLALILTDSNLFRGGDDAQLAAVDDAGQGALRQEPGALLNPDGNGSADDTAADKGPAGDSDEAAGTPDNTATGTDAASPADAAAPQDSGASVAEPVGAQQPDSRVAQGSEPNEASAGKEPDVAAGLPAAVPADPAGDAAPLPPSHRFTATDRHKMAAVWNSDSGEWSLINTVDPLSPPDWASVATRNVVGVFEPLQFGLAAQQSGWSTIVAGPALVRGINQGVPGVELLEGRMVVRHDPTNPVAKEGQPVEFRLAAGAGATRLTLQTPDTVVGVEVAPLPQLLLAGFQPPAAPPAAPTVAEPDAADNEPAGAAAAGDEPAALATTTRTAFRLNRLPIGNLVQITVYAAEGSVLVTLPGDQPAQEISKGRMISWVADDTSVSTVNVSPPGQLGVVPEWIYSLTSPALPELEELRSRLAQAFAQTSSLSTAAETLSNDRNPQIATLATGILSMTRDIDRLLGLLLKSDSEAVRRAAIDGLRQAMYQKESNQVLVTDALENRLPMGEIDAVLRLLKGVSQVAAEDRDTSTWLVSMLESDRAAVRELAIYNLEQLTDERYSFYADGDHSRRNDAVRRWHRHLSRNDGTLVKAP